MFCAVDFGDDVFGSLAFWDDHSDGAAGSPVIRIVWGYFWDLKVGDLTLELLRGGFHCGRVLCVRVWSSAGRIKCSTLVTTSFSTLRDFFGFSL